MRNLTKLAIAVVLVGAGAGMQLPVGGDHRDIAVTTNNHENVLNVIQQDFGQKDQNLKLLLAGKIVEGARRGDGGSSGDGRGDPAGSRGEGRSGS